MRRLQPSTSWTEAVIASDMGEPYVLVSASKPRATTPRPRCCATAAMCSRTSSLPSSHTTSTAASSRRSLPPAPQALPPGGRGGARARRCQGRGLDGIAATAGPGLLGSLLVGLSLAESARFRTRQAVHRRAPHRGPHHGQLAGGGHAFPQRGAGHFRWAHAAHRDDRVIGQSSRRWARRATTPPARPSTRSARCSAFRIRPGRSFERLARRGDPACRGLCRARGSSRVRSTSASAASRPRRACARTRRLGAAPRAADRRPSRTRIARRKSWKHCRNALTTLGERAGSDRRLLASKLAPRSPAPACATRTGGRRRRQRPLRTVRDRLGSVWVDSARAATALCTDNAAMIACAGGFRLRAGEPRTPAECLRARAARILGVSARVMFS